MNMEKPFVSKDFQPHPWDDSELAPVDNIFLTTCWPKKGVPGVTTVQKKVTSSEKSPDGFHKKFSELFMGHGFHGDLRTSHIYSKKQPGRIESFKFGVIHTKRTVKQ